MSGHSGTRPHTGAPPRVLSVMDLIGERERLKAQPASAERSAALKAIRRRIERIGLRSERRGA